MTTAAQRDAMRRRYLLQRASSERAAMLGDRAGSMIAAGEARRTLQAMVAGVEADIAERNAQ